MSKRRINQQQLSRIKTRQDNYHTSTNSNMSEGLVIARYSKHVLVEDASGITVRCVIRANINSLTAGDRVIYQWDANKNAVVVSCLPRLTVLSRVNERGVSRAIAANVTQFIVVIAPNPQISWILLDSYLVMAEILQISACIVLNKSDLKCEEIKHVLTRDYAALGYNIIITNKGENNHPNLVSQLQNHVSVFVGQSGVGKSSLISSLLPDLKEEIKTAAISENSNLGCHTTRNARLYHFASGGDLIDSPGVREFNLRQISAIEIARGYREFRPYLGQCKFRNCEHLTSPGCAILAAIKNNEISQQRYENYVKISTQELF
jgi:ribosome biogenesis GTPase / thiamine phosphate phosphatase